MSRALSSSSEAVMRESRVGSGAFGLAAVFLTVTVSGSPVFEAKVLAPEVLVAPVFAAPVFAAPVFAAPVFAAPVFAAPVFAAPVFAATVFAATVFAATVFAATVFAATVFAATVFLEPVFLETVVLETVFVPAALVPAVLVVRAGLSFQAPIDFAGLAPSRKRADARYRNSEADPAVMPSCTVLCREDGSCPNLPWLRGVSQPVVETALRPLHEAVSR